MLPNEVIWELGLRLAPKDLFKLCLLSRRYNSLLCSDDYFWRNKFLRDWGEPDLELGSWKEMYKYKMPGKVYMSGSIDLDQTDLYTPGYVTYSVPTQTTETKAVSISAGNNHVVMIGSDHLVWTFGDNSYGQLGYYTSNAGTLTPERVSSPGGPLKAKKVSAGGNHTMIISLDDTVWVFGRNDSGQLGLGYIKENQRIPTQISMPSKAKAVSAGNEHSILIDLNDSIWTFGDGTKGRLGYVTGRAKNPVPRMVLLSTGPLKAKAVSAGYDHSAIIDFNNEVWTFGANFLGQLGRNGFINSPQPAKISSPGLKAKVVHAGTEAMFIIDFHNRVWGVGGNGDGQLGIGTTATTLTFTQVPIPQVIAVSMGENHTAFLDTEGTVWISGDERYQTIVYPERVPGIIVKAIAASESATFYISKSE